MYTYLRSNSIRASLLVDKTLVRGKGNHAAGKFLMYLMAYTAKQSQPTILIRNFSYLSLCCYVDQDGNGNGEYKKSYIQTENRCLKMALISD